MTSEQVRLILTQVLVLVAVMLPGCELTTYQQPVASPYASRQVWAVAPLRNESGSQSLDSYRLADHLTEQLQAVQGIDVLPVNRVLSAMASMNLDAVTTRQDAIALRQVLGVDGLVVGSVTAFGPYDPLKLGLALDLYVGVEDTPPPLDIRGLTWAPTGPQAGLQSQTLYSAEQPMTSVSGVFNVGDPAVKARLQAYTRGRGVSDNDEHAQRLYEIDMNLYSEFVSREIGSQLIWAEAQRLTHQYAARQQQAAALVPADP